MLRIFFNDAMSRANPYHQSGDSVMSVYLNLPKKFGFVEFRSIEEATAALQLDGITFHGCDLKVRRPSDYDNNGPMMEPKVVPTLDVTKLGIVSTQVPDGPNKVFCGGLPYDLGEREVKELVSVYGHLKAFHLVKDKDAVASKGYCFFEYSNPDVTDAAIMGLNGIAIGNKTLTVRRAQPKAALGVVGGSAVLNAAAAAAAATGMPMIQPQMPVASMAGMPLNAIASLGGMPLAALGAMPMMPGMIPMMPGMIPTRVICLLQMVTPDELTDDTEYQEILEDVEEECKKYGDVRSVVIPRPGRDPPSGVGKVFVEFSNTDEAARARAALEGRQFASRVVAATFHSEEAFARREL